eukprot:442478_1
MGNNSARHLVLGELLAAVTGGLGDVLEDVVADGLGQGAALANNDVITVADTVEGGAHVNGEVLVALHVTLVLLDPVEVVAGDDQGVLHLLGLDLGADDAATDGHVTGEGALLVDVLALDGSLGGLEAQTDVLPVADATGLVGVLGGLDVLVDTGLGLVGTLDLDGDVDLGGAGVLGDGGNHFSN